MRRNGLKSGLLLSTSMMTAILGYGRRAYGQAVCGTGTSTILCVGTASYVNYANGAYGTAPGTDYTFMPGGVATNITVTLGATTFLTTNAGYPTYNYRPGDLIRITGDGNVGLIANENSYLYSQTGNAVYLYNTDVYSTGDVRVTTNFKASEYGPPTYGVDWGFTGYVSAIRALNNGDGDIILNLNNRLEGVQDGVVALHYGGGDINVTVGNAASGVDDGSITATGTNAFYDGLVAQHYGTGTITITVNGDISSAGWVGIQAYNNLSALDGGTITLNMGDGQVYGYQSGAVIRQNGTFAGVVVTADPLTDTGSLTGGNYAGLVVYNSGYGGVDIDLGDTEVSGGTAGIAVDDGTYGDVSVAVNGSVYGGNTGIVVYAVSGDVAVTTGDGDVTGQDFYGIFVRSGYSGYYFNPAYGSTTVTTGTGAVYGGNVGIKVETYASTGVEIDTTGDVTGNDGAGIFVDGQMDEGVIDIATGAGAVSGNGGDGIYVQHNGGDGVIVTTIGDVSGTGGTAPDLADGIHIDNYSGYVTVEAGAGAVEGAGDGIDIYQDGFGSVEVTTTGDVTGNGGDGIRVVSYGYSVTIDIGAGDVTGSGSMGSGLFVENTSGFVDIDTSTGDVTGNNDGITVSNSGNDGVTVTTGASLISGELSAGIDVLDDGTGGITIETGDGGDVGAGVYEAARGGVFGIRAFNSGGGAIQITTGSGAVIGEGLDGVQANNQSDGGVTITTGSGDITGGETAGSNLASGIKVYDGGAGGVTITVNESDVTGDLEAVYVRNYYGGSVTINTYDGNLTGEFGQGIDVRNRSGGADDGAVTITTRDGSVTGKVGDGIYALNEDDGGISITTGDGAVLGGTDAGSTMASVSGISASDEGLGGISITTGSGNVAGDSEGIYAGNQGGGAVTIKTYGGNILGRYGYGIYVRSLPAGSPTGSISITTGDGYVYGQVADGIFAYNGDDGGISVTTGSGSIVGGADAGVTVGAHNGIDLDDSGAGGITLIVNASDVTGDSNGVDVENAGGGSISITTNAGNVEGLYGNGIDAYNDDGTVDLTITLNSTGTVKGGDSGIVAENNGTGTLSINTADGDITGYDDQGILAIGGEPSGSLTITVDGTADITGNDRGIAAYGDSGAVQILAALSTGVITGEGRDGIYVNTGATQEFGVTITTGAGYDDVAVYGYTNGIGVDADGSGAIEITTGAGSVSGENGDGINVASAYGDSVTIRTFGGAIAGGDDGIDVYSESGSVYVGTGSGSITGFDEGIYVSNSGDGGVEIVTTTGLVQGENGNGIDATDTGDGNLVITTGAGDSTGLAVDGRLNGILAVNGGEGYIDVTINDGDVVGGNDGINLTNAFGTSDITLTLAGAADVTGTSQTGIRTLNDGFGGTTIDLSAATGRVTGDQFGIYAKNDLNTEDGITITTGAGYDGVAVYSNTNDAIRAANFGEGSIEITTGTGAIESDEGEGIDAYGYFDNDGITIETASGAVTGGENGIRALNYGGSLIQITTADGLVEGESVDGISALNQYGGNINITTGAGDSTGVAVLGAQNGIDAYLNGSGSIDIEVGDGDVTGTNYDGIYAYTNGIGDIGITLTGSANVTGGENGIFASGDDGLITIDASAATGVIRGNSRDGIFAAAYSDGDTVTVTTGAGYEGLAVIGQDDGIEVYNQGTGAANVYTGTGAVTGTAGNGIEITAKYYSGSVKIDTGDGTVQGGTNGIYVNAEGYGNVDITTDGEVIGQGNDGIYVRNGGYNLFTGNVTGGSVNIITNALVDGKDDGISVNNDGQGYVNITAYGEVSGENGSGIYANSGYVYNGYAYGGGLTITTEAYVYGGGASGILARNDANGQLQITTKAEVVGGGGTGIFATNGYMNNGNIYGSNVSITTEAEVTGYIDGIYAQNRGTGYMTIRAEADVIGQNGDGITARNGSIDGDYQLVSGTDLSIITEGQVLGQDGDGISAVNIGTGSLYINTYGLVDGDYGDGIYAFNGTDVYDAVRGTNLSITANADVTGYGAGIFARNRGSGLVEIVVDGNVTGETGNGLVAVAGSEADGQVYGTGIEIDVYGEVTSNNGTGIYSKNFGDGSIDIYVEGAVYGGGNTGIFVVNGIYRYGVVYGDDIRITTDDTVTGDQNGIVALNSGTGEVSVTAYGDVTGEQLYGVYVRNGTFIFSMSGDISAGTDVTIETSGVVSGQTDGINSVNSGDGSTNISTDGAVYAEVGDGIYARNGIFQSGTVFGQDLYISTEELVQGGDSGIVAINSGDGLTEIDADAEVTGYDGDGIFAQNGRILSPTSVAGTSLRIYASEAVYGSSDGIYAVNLGSQDLRIVTNGTVTGENGIGILAVNGSVSATGGTDLTITTYDSVLGGTTGIDGANFGSGDLNITVDADVTGEDGLGISATNSAEGDELTVSTYEGTRVTGGTGGIFAANSGRGATTIEVDGDEVTGNNGAGIQVLFSNLTGEGADVNIGSASLVQGSLGAILGDGSTGQRFGIYSAGTMQNLSGNDFDQLINITDATVSIQNVGTMTGAVVVDEFNDFLGNYGIWNLGGTSNFGLGTDQIVNASTINAADDALASEITVINGLETFDNHDGLISLQDSTTGGGSTTFDSLQITGNFDGISSFLALDASLGGAGSDADTLIISGTATGQTSILLNNASAGPGGLNANILLVDTGGATGTEFVLADGPFYVGAYVYDLFFDDALDDFFLRSALDTLRLDAATLPSIIGDVWEVTASSWHRNTVQLQGSGAGITPSTSGASPAMGASNVQGWGTLIFDNRDSEGTIIADVGGSPTPLGAAFDQTTTAFIGGVDLVLPPDANGGTVTVGALIGVIDSTVDFAVTGNRSNFNGLTYGVHVAYASDLLRADLLVKRDDLELEYTVAGLGADPGRADTSATGVSLEFGYKIHQGERMSVEAVGNLSHVVTQIDDFTVDGTDFSFEDSESTRGAIGLTFRGTYPLGGTNVMPSATIKYWNVFDGGYTSAIDATTFSYENTGGYVEATATLEFQDPNSGWTGFVSGTGFVGDERNGVRAQMGLNLEW